MAAEPTRCEHTSQAAGPVVQHRSGEATVAKDDSEMIGIVGDEGFPNVGNVELVHAVTVPGW